MPACSFLSPVQYSSRYSPFFVIDHFKFRYLNEMGVLMRWWMLLYVYETTVEDCFLFLINLLKMQKWKCKLLLASFLHFYVQKTVCRRICFVDELQTKLSHHQTLGKLGMQERRRPDNGSLVREQEWLILRHGKFTLPSNLAKGNLFH